MMGDLDLFLTVQFYKGRSLSSRYIIHTGYNVYYFHINSTGGYVRILCFAVKFAAV